MAIIITILLVILSTIFGKSKFVAGLFFLFMWIMWGWNSWNGDYDGYQKIYEDSTSIDFRDFYELGYSILNWGFRSLEFSFQSFMIFFSFIVLMLVYSCSLKMTKYPAIFAMIYYLLFILQFVFMRNYLSVSLIFSATLFAIKNEKYGLMTYILTTLLAATFHITSILYLIFIPAFSKRSINTKNIIIFVFIAVLLFSNRTSLSFLNQIMYFGDFILSRILLYSDGLSQYASLKTSMFHCGVVGLILFLNYKIPNYFILSKDNQRCRNVIININKLSLFYIIFYAIIPYLMRFIWYLFTIDAIYMLLILHITKQQKIKRKYLKLVMVAIIIYIAMILTLIYTSTLENTLYPLYNRNLIF